MVNTGSAVNNGISLGDLLSPLSARHGSLAFGPFRLDMRSCRLFRDDLEVVLRPQAFRVLAVLVRTAGQPVDYAQMTHEAWNGARVSRHSVAVTIGEVRKALLEYGSWIRYRPRIGFCLEIPKSENRADEAEIQVFEERLMGALRAKDLALIIAAYASDESLLVFDAISPRQSVVAGAYGRKRNYPLATFPGPIEPEWNYWGFSMEGSLGYAHGPLKITTAGKATLTVLITHVLRKINGSWLIVHEHVSIPPTP
ncbi:MAG TPA: winged helix-turn-helix domain-containing protein [Bryobacteraceae bacterium]|nr:winged helix-turn-helix domain-containing protein [Bryobacteraceae bacterium]